MAESRKPTVTIFADASYCHRSGSAGWAAWIKADGYQSMTVGAAIKVKITHANEAELAAIANALCVARLRGIIRKNDVVMVQSDCVTALAIIRGRCGIVEDRPAAGGLSVDPITKMKLRPQHRSAIAVINETIAATGATLITRHVRGHQPGAGRQWVNNTVDQIARSHMRASRRTSQQQVMQ